MKNLTPLFIILLLSFAGVRASTTNPEFTQEVYGSGPCAQQQRWNKLLAALVIPGGYGFEAPSKEEQDRVLSAAMDVLERGGLADGTTLLSALEHANPTLIAALRILGKAVFHGSMQDAEKLVEEFLSDTRADNKAAIALALVRPSQYLSSVDKNGNTPLHEAVIEESGAAVRALVLMGVDQHVQNHKGQTAMDIALQQGLEDIVRILSRFPSFHQLKAREIGSKIKRRIDQGAPSTPADYWQTERNWSNEKEVIQNVIFIGSDSEFKREMLQKLGVLQDGETSIEAPEQTRAIRAAQDAEYELALATDRAKAEDGAAQVTAVAVNEKPDNPRDAVRDSFLALSEKK